MPAKPKRGRPKGVAGGRKGSALPRKAPVHAAGPKVGSPAWHEGKRAAMAAQGDRARARHHGGHRMPGVRSGGFSCTNCGHMDWRLHPVATKEGKHHQVLAFKGCARCGTMHPTTHHVAKHEGRFVDVAKAVDSSETALQGPGPELVGHRTSCPRGGSSPCGKAVQGRCGICNAQVQDHEAVGKTMAATIGELRKLAEAM